MQEIEIYSSRTNALKLLLISLTFVVMGYLLIQSTETKSTKYYIFIFGMIFFGYGVIVAVYRLIRTRLILKISSEGIYHKKKHYKWEEISRTVSTSPIYQNNFSIYLKTYENPKGSILKDYKNLRKGNKISIIIDNEDIDMIELENLTNYLIQNKPENRQILILQSEIFKKRHNYFIHFLLLLTYLFISIWDIKTIIITSIITVIAVLILRWHSGGVTNSKLVRYSEMLALIGFLNFGLLGIGVFAFDEITNSIGNKLTIQIESYKNSHNQYPEGFAEIEKNANLNLFENLLINRISYQKASDNYSLYLKKYNSKIKEYDKNTKEWK